MKSIFVIIFLFFLTIYAEAQNNDLHVTTSSGDIYQSANYAVEWTLGEPLTSTLLQDTIMLTQGFQQNYLKKLPDFNFETQQVCVGQYLALAAVPVLPHGSYFWDFGNGLTEENSSAITSYHLAGTFSVTLKYTYQCVSKTVQKFITVNPKTPTPVIIQD